MKFPLGLVADFLSERGFHVAKAPANLRATFDWVALDPDPSEAEGRAILGVSSVYRPECAGFPAILVSAGDAWSDRDDVFLVVHSGKTPATIAEDLQLYLVGIYEWIEDMHHALASHCSCSELLELSEPILRNYVSVTDSVFTYIAHTPNIAPIEEASRHLVEEGRYSDEVIKAMRASGLSELWARNVNMTRFESNAINPLPSIEHVYHLNSQYAAHLVMVCPEPVTPGQEFLFSLLIEPVGTVLNNMWRVNNPVKQRYTPFLTDLAHGNQRNLQGALRQAKALGLPVEGVFKVLLISDAWKGGSADYFAVRSITLFPECKVLVEGDRLAIIVMLDSSSVPSRMSRIEHRVFDLAGTLDTAVGVSRKFFNLFGLANALAEARIALEYGGAFHADFPESEEGVQSRCANTGIYRFKRYFPYFAVDPGADRADFFRRYDIVGQVLGPIQEDDERNGTSDFKILRAYLRHGCRVNAASRELAMHRNSVSYRLKHIEDAYDFDLEDPDERLFLGTLMLLPRHDARR